MAEKKKKVVYIAGPITGVAKYWEPFEIAEDTLIAKGLIALNPAKLPQGMTNDKYARICAGMIDSADAVLFLPDWQRSQGAAVEWNYCKYTDKPVAYSFAELVEVLKR